MVSVAGAAFGVSDDYTGVGSNHFVQTTAHKQAS